MSAVMPMIKKREHNNFGNMVSLLTHLVRHSWMMTDTATQGK